jgi:hypothetical protein
MGRRRDGNHSLQKNNSVQNSVGNEENGHPVPDLKINVTKESSDTHKKTLKAEISEKFMKKILDMVNQNVQDTLKKFQDTKNKDYEMAQKQIQEFRGEFNKYQSETKYTIKREIQELKRTTQII